MEWIKRMILGVTISVTVFCLLGLAFMDAQIRNSIISVMIMGGIIGELSYLYETNMSLLSASLLHVIGSLIAFIGAAYFANWFPFDLGIILGSAGLFLVIFMLIWTFFYFDEKRKLQDINEKLSVKHH